MAMIQTGVVTESSAEKAKVRVDRESACGGNCAGCHGCPTGAVFVTCPNNQADPLRPGDMVQIEMPARAFFQNAFWSYGALAILMLAGALFGYWISGREAGSVLGAFGALALGILVLRIVFCKRKVNLKITKLKQQQNP